MDWSFIPDSKHCPLEKLCNGSKLGIEAASSILLNLRYKIIIDSIIHM